MGRTGPEGGALMDWISVDDEEKPPKYDFVMAVSVREGRRHLLRQAIIDDRTGKWMYVNSAVGLYPLAEGEVVTHWRRYPPLPD